MKDKLKVMFNEHGFELSALQLEQFEQFYHFLVAENEKFNLTAITSEDEVIKKHFLDSVLPVKEFPLGAKVIDVGSGAGFPGIPLKILRQDLEVTLIDSLQKRVNFLNQAIDLLNLKNITAIHTRAEDFAAKQREKYDIAVSRAVAQTNTLLEYLLPLIKIGGKALIYKSTKAQEELAEAKNAIKTLGGAFENITNYQIDDMTRCVVIIKKISPCPKQYPRGKNLPKTMPIC